MELTEPAQNIDTREVIKESRTPLQIDYYSIKKSSLILRALNHKLRQQIIKIIDEEGKITVTEIYINPGWNNPLYLNTWLYCAEQESWLPKEKENLFFIP